MLSFSSGVTSKIVPLTTPYKLVCVSCGLKLMLESMHDAGRQCEFGKTSRQKCEIVGKHNSGNII